METRQVTLKLGQDRHLRAVLSLPPTADRKAALILGHGANNTMDHPLIAGVHERLAQEGLVTVRFNFPYAEEGKKRPDPDAVLEVAFRLVVEYAAGLEEFRGLEMFLGGKSMGARVAAQIVAQGAATRGLVFLGYPLHPPGKPDKLRDRPLLAFSCPTLFIQGGRDPFCQLELLGKVLSQVKGRADLHVLPGRGHSYERGGKTVSEDTLAEVVRVILAWMGTL
jgi:predicted alpha/beta-hydrolase family hydrolase